MTDRGMEKVTPPLAPSWFPPETAFAWRLGYDQGRSDVQQDIAIGRHLERQEAKANNE